MKSLNISLCQKVLTFFLLLLALHFNSLAQNQVLHKLEQPNFRADTTTIINFGAKGDGVHLNTQAYNAFSACNKKGGGVVLLPSGVCLTGSIE